MDHGRASLNLNVSTFNQTQANATRATLTPQGRRVRFDGIIRAWRIQRGRIEQTMGENTSRTNTSHNKNKHTHAPMPFM